MPLVTFEDELSEYDATTFSTFNSDADDILLERLENEVFALRQNKDELLQELEKGNIEYNELYDLYTQLHEKSKELEINLEITNHENMKLYEEQKCTSECCNVLENKDIRYMDHVIETNQKIEGLEYNYNKEKDEINLTLNQLQEKYLNKQEKIKYMNTVTTYAFIGATIFTGIIGILKLTVRNLLKQYSIIDTAFNFSGISTFGIALTAGLQKIVIIKTDIIDTKQNKDSIKL